MNNEEQDVKNILALTNFRNLKGNDMKHNSLCHNALQGFSPFPIFKIPTLKNT